MPMDWMGPRVYPNYWYDVFNNNGERGRERGGGGGGRRSTHVKAFSNGRVGKWGSYLFCSGVQCEDNARVCSIMCTS